MNHFDWESQLLEENKTLRQIISDTANEDLADALKYQKLRGGIDKATEEIKEEIYSGSWNNDFCLGMKHALRILKRNIGE